MSLSSEMIDQLSFEWDDTVTNKIKSRNVIKVTSSTERHLEEYFAFLEDAIPTGTLPKKRTYSERKMFELDMKQCFSNRQV